MDRYSGSLRCVAVDGEDEGLTAAGESFECIVAAICLALLEAIYDRIVSWGASIVFLAAVVAVLFAARLLAG